MYIHVLRSLDATLFLPQYQLMVNLQGDQAAWTKPPVDIDVKVAFLYKDLIQKHNFKSMSMGGFVQASRSLL